MAGQQPRDRWKRVLDAQEAAMGMMLGRLFVQAHFPEAAKRRYAALVEAIRSAYRERIGKLDWMSAPTKARALAKLEAITKKVGYPDTWKDYGPLANIPEFHEAFGVKEGQPMWRPPSERVHIW